MNNSLLIDQESSISDDNPLISSWVDIVDKERGSELEEKTFSVLCTDNIINADYKKESLQGILSDQNKIIKHLGGLFKRPNNKEEIMKCLDWLIETTEHQCNVNRFTIMNSNNNKGETIHRSSYKFCNYNYECEFNYNKKSKGCFAQHYVYNFVYTDLKSLKNYLVDKTETVIMDSEINKSMNTIIYVFKHMLEELNNAQSLYKSNKNRYKFINS